MAETPLSEWLYAYRKLMAVDMACRLGIFNLLDERPRSAGELAAATGARPVPLTVLLDACVGLGLLSVENDVYADRTVARVYLVEDRPLYQGDLFRLFASEAPLWHGLRDLLLEDKTAPGEQSDRSEGGSLHGSGDDVSPQQFTRAMHALGVLGEAGALAGSIDLSGRRDLVDVGCGSGVYALALCRRYPELRATLIDRPDVLELTRGYLVRDSLEARVSLVAGDFTRDSYGEGRDVVLLSDVLYLESDVCRSMLRLAFQALRPGGLLLIRGYFGDRTAGQGPFGALFDLDRLLTDSSREPLLVERILGWLEGVGFEHARWFPLTERSTCIVADR